MESWNVRELVYRTSLLLLYPTLALLAVGFLRMMWHLGEAVQDAWIGRGQRKQDAIRQLRDIHCDELGSLVPSLTVLARSREQHAQLRRFVQQLLDELDRGPRGTLAARIDHLVGQSEAALAQDVNRARVPVRLGPLLGLIGTLIPLGPGLMALNEGDLGQLSGQLVVAFSTTVVGLLIGGVSYAIAMSRAHTADVVAGDVELVADLVCTLLELRVAEKSPGRTRPMESEEVHA